jgi:hypothetical protein
MAISGNQLRATAVVDQALKVGVARDARPQDGQIRHAPDRG